MATKKKPQPKPWPRVPKPDRKPLATAVDVDRWQEKVAIEMMDRAEALYLYQEAKGRI